MCFPSYPQALTNKKKVKHDEFELYHKSRTQMRAGLYYMGRLLQVSNKKNVPAHVRT